jgi:hypothetical protein
MKAACSGVWTIRQGEREMAKMQKAQRVKDYGNDQINRLALAVDALEKMEADERYRAFIWFKSKYAKEWPSSDQ